MKMTQCMANVILHAENHNPSIVSKDWLMQQSILTEHPIDFKHFPFFSSVETETYTLLVDQQVLNLNLKVINESTLPELADMMKRYVAVLSHIPYKAVGFNISWLISDINANDILKDVFVGDRNKLLSIVGEHHGVGGILFYNHDTFQAELTARPISANEVSININFNSNINNVEDLLDMAQSIPIGYGKRTRHCH